MPSKPGRYSDECTDVRTRTRATGVLLLVIGGDRGDGFEVQVDPDEILSILPDALEQVANDIRRDIRKRRR